MNLTKETRNIDNKEKEEYSGSERRNNSKENKSYFDTHRRNHISRLTLTEQTINWHWHKKQWIDTDIRNNRLTVIEEAEDWHWQTRRNYYQETEMLEPLNGVLTKSQLNIVSNLTHQNIIDSLHLSINLRHIFGFRPALLAKGEKYNNCCFNLESRCSKFYVEQTWNERDLFYSWF